MSLSEDQRARYEVPPVSAGKLYPRGYGTVLQVSETRRDDGTVEAVYDYSPILQPDSTQTEGVGSYRALYAGQELLPQARFRLLECAISSDEGTFRRIGYREVGQYIISLPKGQLDYYVKLRRNGDTVDLIAGYPAGVESTFHRVPLTAGGIVILPATVILHPPRAAPPVASPERREAEAKDLLTRQQATEALANELILEARTRLGIREVDAEGKEMILSQIAKLDEELKPVSMVSQPIAIRYVNQLNQMRALIHDMQVTIPPLFNRAMTREWLSKIGA